MSTVDKSAEGKGKCIHCRSETDNVTSLFDAWICDELCEEKVIDKYLDLLQKRIKQYEISIGLEDSD